MWQAFLQHGVKGIAQIGLLVIQRLSPSSISTFYILLCDTGRWGCHMLLSSFAVGLLLPLAVALEGDSKAEGESRDLFFPFC